MPDNLKEINYKNEAPTQPKKVEKLKKPLITIQGTLTAQIQLRGEDCQEPYYYSFIRLKGQKIDLPVIFKIKENDKPVKPSLKKSDQVELTGHYSNSPHSIRKSFTATSYQLLNHKKVRKKPDNYLNQQEENKNIFTK
jgi:predicted DNA binding protein